MKKILMVAILMIGFIGCGKKDDDGSGGSGKKIHPPAWIQGTWVEEKSFPGAYMEIRFTKNDFCIVGNVEKVCFAEPLARDPNAEVEEEISESEYTIFIESKYASASYRFKKISSRKILASGTGLAGIDFELVRK